MMIPLSIAIEHADVHDEAG